MAAVLGALLVVASGTLAGDRGPSTPEERKKAVDLVVVLESDPFGAGAQAARTWLTEWTIEVPDISVKVCADLMGPALDKKYPYSSEVGLQPLFSATRFAIEHPDQAKDDNAMYTAGTEGALHVYELILKTKPDARLGYLDDLLARRDRGELPAYVAKVAKRKCKS
jgi:hypothetical protein